MKVVSYIVFGCSEDFEEWQKKNPETGIISVSPFVGNVSGQQKGNDLYSDISLNAPINVFVTYFKEV